MTRPRRTSGSRYLLLLDQLRIDEISTEDITHYLVTHRETGRHHRLYEQEHLVALLFDGERDLEEIAQLAGEASGVTFLAVDVDRFAQQLIALGFAEEIPVRAKS